MERLEYIYMWNNGACPHTGTGTCFWILCRYSGERKEDRRIVLSNLFINVHMFTGTRGLYRQIYWFVLFLRFAKVLCIYWKVEWKLFVLTWFFYLIYSWSDWATEEKPECVNFAGTRAGSIIIDVCEERLDIISSSPFKKYMKWTHHELKFIFLYSIYVCVLVWNSFHTLNKI